MSKFEQLNQICFKRDKPIREVMDTFSDTAVHTQGVGFGLVVSYDKKCIGVVTDGDLRRYLSEGASIEDPVQNAMSAAFEYATQKTSSHQLLRMFDQRIRHIPVLDDENRPFDLIQFANFRASARLESRIIRARAPVRISFSGGGTDMSYFFKDKTGYVLSTTINKFCYASIGVRSDNKIRLQSKDFHQEVTVDTIQDLKYGNSLELLKACVKLMDPNFGFDLICQSDIDPGTGLGGSSAMSAAIVGALNHFRNENHLDNYQLADLTYQAERVELGIPGGWQDQYSAVFGGLNLMEFRKDDILVIPLRVADATMLELRFSLQLFRLGKSRESGPIIRDQQLEYQNSSKIMRRYESMQETTLKMKDSLLKGSLDEFGYLLHQGWQIKRSFSNKISNPYIDDIYDTARAEGALGGKLLGAGDSGYMLLFCNPEYQEKVRASLEAKGATLELFDFHNSGLQTWTTPNII